MARLGEGLEVFVVVTIVVCFAVALRSQRQTYGARGKIVHLAPNHRRQIESVIGAVEMKSLLLPSFTDNHVKTARHGDEKLVAQLERVTTSVRPAGHVVEVKHPFDVKGHKS